MAAPYEWMIGTRYLRSTQRRSFLSLTSIVSVLGLAVGVAVLLIVLSVMNGFERELRSRILSVTSHATLMGLNGTLPNWRDAERQAGAYPGVVAAAPYVEAQAMLAHGNVVSGTVIRGVDPLEELKAVGLAQRIQGGSVLDLKPGSFQIVLGDTLAEALGVKVGDALILITPVANATPAGLAPRMRRLRVAGLFHSGVYEYDRGLALLNLKDAQLLYRMGDEVTGLRLALTDPFSAPRLTRALAPTIPGVEYYSDWTRKNATFFSSIQTTKSMLFVILLLVVAVAAINVVATLVMVVKNKRADIAILRTLGAAPANILAAFTVQGAMIGLIGTLGGVALGWLISDNLERLVHGLEHLLGTQFLDAKVYLMSDLPAYVEWGDVLHVSALAFLLCALATLYPAWRAALTQPAEALRHD